MSSPSSLGRWCRPKSKVMSRIDQRDMRKGLREIAQHAPGNGIVFLGQEADIVAEREKKLEELHRLIAPSEHDEVVRVPE